MKTIGIIGGLGPETTAEFYLECIFSSFEKNSINRPPILIWNVPLDFAIEEEFILHAKGVERYIPYLVDAAQRLERGGADFIVMPCNSLHVLIDKIRGSVKIPVLSIVEETVKFLTARHIARVGILATNATLENKLYESALLEAGIAQTVPDGLEQARIGKMINALVRQRRDNKDREELLKIIKHFSEQGIKHVILACTDLQLLVPEIEGMQIFDTMKIFAQAAVSNSFG